MSNMKQKIAIGMTLVSLGFITQPIYEYMTDPLARVQYKVNAIGYVSDLENYGVEDYRASPEEFYKYGGDCEDFAIAKRAALLSEGIPKESMDYVLFPLEDGVWHVVLRVKYKGKIFILDNRSPWVQPEEYIETHSIRFYIPHEQFIK